jgi:tyrosine-specific transport protein
VESFLTFFALVGFVVGNTVGGGVLAIPVVAGSSGFWPATLGCVLTGLMMLTSALYLLKAFWRNGQIVSFSDIYEHYFGRTGRVLFEFFFFFLFLCLLTAYLSGITDLLCVLTGGPRRIVQTIVVIAGAFLLWRGLHATLFGNNVLMVFLLLTFLWIVCTAAGGVRSQNLSFLHWSELSAILPIFLCSYGIHNMLPVVLRLANNNYYLSKSVIVAGTAVVFCINFLFLVVVLGNVPPDAILRAARDGASATIALGHGGGNKVFISVGNIFALLAIATSYLSVGGSVVTFCETAHNWSKMIIFAVVIGIPLIITSTFPHLFLKAMSLGAGVGCNVIFGILPGYIRWKTTQSRSQRVCAAIIILLFAYVLGVELWGHLGQNLSTSR